MGSLAMLYLSPFSIEARKERVKKTITNHQETSVKKIKIK